MPEVRKTEGATCSGFFALLWAKIAFWKHARMKHMDQMFMDSFNKSNSAWVKKGWVKKLR
jgi:hypothetical protein